jgi:hypothetical protein
MYSREDFIERFKGMETALLVHRLTTGDLTDEARDAVCQVLHERGVPMGSLDKVAQDTPEQDIAQHALRIKHGNCPLCHRSGSGVEVRESYWVWSALVITRWQTRRAVCCRACGVHENWNALGFSLGLGWWGIPAGILLTPCQITRNLLAIARRREKPEPSKALLRIAKDHLLAQRRLELERLAQ